MEIYTSYFGNLRRIKQKGITPIAIAVSPPGWYKGYRYRRFAPTVNMLKMDLRRYDIEFQRLLAILSPREVYRDLERMAEGKPIALLCFETYRRECHRLQVAEWIERNMKISVPELDAPARSQKRGHQTMLF